MDRAPPFIHASPATVVDIGTAIPGIGAWILMPSGRMSRMNMTTCMP
jgi:hypothetical protein